MWAVAEVTWEDSSGIYKVRGTLEDTSQSGACLRVKRAFTIGSRIIIKWHREQFSAVTRNCRQDGYDFLLGVRREPEGHKVVPQATLPKPAKSERADLQEKELPAAPALQAPALATAALATPALATSGFRPLRQFTAAKPPAPKPRLRRVLEGAAAPPAGPVPRSEVLNHDVSPSQERKYMEPKRLFQHFWRRPPAGDAPEKSMPKEALVNKPNTNAAESTRGPQSDLLSYDDIYRAAGIMSSRSGYGIHKVVDMLNSDRIRDLSPDAKRASVLMALDAAGTSSDDLLNDALRRQSALDSYEAGQRKQVEDFEVRKNAENTHIEGELEKIRGHYAERMQANRDQVTREKEALRNWQAAMQHESQRIKDVIELCGERPAAAPKASAAAASAGSSGSETSAKSS
jgi:hypothetical protein